MGVGDHFQAWLPLSLLHPRRPLGRQQPCFPLVQQWWAPPRSCLHTVSFLFCSPASPSQQRDAYLPLLKAPPVSKNDSSQELPPWWLLGGRATLSPDAMSHQLLPTPTSPPTPAPAPGLGSRRVEGTSCSDSQIALGMGMQGRGGEPTVDLST